MDSVTWWIVLLIGCALLELSSPGLFFFLSFSVGAGVAGLFSLFAHNPAAEFVVFLGASFAGFFFLKRFIKRISKDTMYTTNVYALRGRKGLVVEPIRPFEKGWVLIDGQWWAAQAVHDETIEKDSVIVVVNSSGSHLVVKKVDNN